MKSLSAITSSALLCAGLLSGGMDLLVPTSADAAAPSTRASASHKRPNTQKRIHVPGRKAYSTRLTSRQATANQGKRSARRANGHSATSKRNAGTFQPIAVTWRDARRHARQTSSGATVQRRSRGGRNVRFRDARAS